LDEGYARTRPWCARLLTRDPGGETLNPNLPLGKTPTGENKSTVPDNAPVVYMHETTAVEDTGLAGSRLWAHRLGMLLFVFFCAVLGVVLVVFPWREEWTSNSLLIGYPGLQDFLANGFVRGMCSGLGLLDIWIGFSEAIHYHE
jgi:hypothetical protein